MQSSVFNTRWQLANVNRILAKADCCHALTVTVLHS